MIRFHTLAALMLCALASHAQEKAMSIQKTDGTQTLTRVAELSKITFLSIADQGKGMIVNTVTADPVTILFEAQPTVTVSAGKLLVSTKTASETVQIEISDISEIKFDKATSLSAPGGTDGVVCVLRSGSALFRGIPHGVVPVVCTTEGRNVPVHACTNGELTLSSAVLGKGIYIVRIGTFTTKITL